VRQSRSKGDLKSGWTKTIRPPVSYTNALKISRWFFTKRRVSPSGMRNHFIPLELGGAPMNPENLWPEPHSQSQLSDPLERSSNESLQAPHDAEEGRAAIRLFKTTQG